MKKILVLFIGLVLAANAWAVPDLGFSLQVGGDEEITIEPSVTVYVDIYASELTGDWPLCNTGELTLTINGPASFIGNDDFTYGVSFWDGFGITNHQYVSNKVLRIQAGYLGAPRNTMLELALDAIAIDHIGVHCDDVGLVTISLASGGAFGTPSYWDEAGDGLTLDADAATAGMTIHQTPEPMTIALLGLGGLFLRRRK